MDSSHFKQLLMYAPNQEEIENLKSYNGDMSKLNEVDVLAIRVGDIWFEAVALNCRPKNQTFYSPRRITTKRVTSLRCPSPRHSAKVTQLFA